MTIADILDHLAHARELGITSLNQCAAILHLHRSGPTPMGELAASIGMSPGGLTDIADQLEKLELATRTKDREDRRKYRLALTTAGTEIAKALLSEPAPIPIA